MYKALDIWLPGYLSHRRPQTTGTVDIMFAICDHFEPFHDADRPEALKRVKRWVQEHPALNKPFRDADGCCPKHSFFYPIEQYDPEVCGMLAQICCATGAEVEIHLHHKNDTAENLARTLQRGIDDFSKHQFLSKDRAGKTRYAFIHGNWALDHSHPKGLNCGVPDELGVLCRTGCYADFTMPSAPDPTQTRTINSIYYAQDTPAPKSHDTGIPVCASSKPIAEPTAEGRLLMVQGPLGLNWERRKLGMLPRIENAEISGVNAPRPDRLRLWLRLGIHVQNQPNWVFIKLHTHGGLPRNMATLLGDPMRRFYEHMLSAYNDGRNFRVHFVTAREMVNIIHAAEEGKTGDAGQYRDYRYQPVRRAGPVA